MKHSAPKLIQNLLKDLTERQRDVLVGRFGLEKGGKVQTLAALGVRYRVTRERIRQIESSAVGALRKKIASDPTCQEIIQKSRNFLKEQGGVATSVNLLEYLKASADDLNQNHLAVILEASKAFFFYPEDKHFWAFYYLDKASLKSATGFVEQWTGHLRGRKEVVLTGKYHSLLEEFLKRRGLKPNFAASYLNISKRIHRNPYGDVGLAEWTEIMPRTIRDRVYLVLKKKKEPLHFRAIAKHINDVFAGRTQASPPTVHNELIKDPRFVLVGRGIYALAEHGYEPGTAREVIGRVLTRNGPLRPRYVILSVQKERFFKPNTVLVNLQNKSHFERLPNGTYQIRES